MKITKSELKKFILNELDKNMERNAGDLYTDPTAGQYVYNDEGNTDNTNQREVENPFTILIGDELETARPSDYQAQKGVVNSAKELLKQGERVWIKSKGGMLSDESYTWEIKLNGDKVVWEEVKPINESNKRNLKTMKITKSMIRGLVKEVLKEGDDYMDTPALSRKMGQAGKYPGDVGYGGPFGYDPNSVNDRIDGLVDTNLVSLLVSNMRFLEDEGFSKEDFLGWIETQI